MKRLLITIIVCLMTSMVFAQWRTEESALQIAKSVESHGLYIKTRAQDKNVIPVYTLKSKDKNRTLLYGFNYEGGGFVLVSGSEYTPEILGYADEGNLPTKTEEMPDGLRYLMGIYQAQIEMAASTLQSKPETKTTTRASTRADITPLIKTQWNQIDPYNNQCPNSSLVGCVGVVMGQMMKYHRYPSKGTGNHNGFDFSAKSWNWDLMLDKYIVDGYTQTQADEVAELLHLAGESVDMSYGIDESGASTHQMMVSLNSFWGYDDAMFMGARSNFSDSDWTQLLYNELQENRPVPYNGFDGFGGHAFIVDGYHEGDFHINWGWGGYCDGYFMINSFVPEPDKPDAYRINQEAIFNVKPADGVKAMANLESPEVFKLSAANVIQGESIRVEIPARNNAVSLFNGKLGVIVSDLETKNSETIYYPVDLELQTFCMISCSVEIPTNGLQDGHSYSVTPIYLCEGTSNYKIMQLLATQPPLVFKVSANGGAGDAAKEYYPRRMVVEEGTGTWCQYCVWGIVGMETMKEKFPDNFIGIAIHSGDAMDCSDSYGLEFTSYPSAYFNRIENSSPTGGTMESYLKNQSGLITDAMVKLNSATYSEDYMQMTVSAYTRFGFDASGTDYRLAYVITENNVGPYLQNNVYAGGEMGEMGGFENKPSPVEVIYSDVARGIFPSNTGAEGSVPSSITACTNYTYDYTFSMPKGIENYDNLEITVLLYNAKTGEIVNADRMACPHGKALIEDVFVDTGDEPGTLAEKLGDDIWDIVNLKVKGKINGKDLATLRHMMGCGDNYWSTGEHKRLKALDLKDVQIVKGGVYATREDSPDFALDEDNVLPDYVFALNSSLQKLITPTSIKKIGMYALANAKSIQEIELHEGLVEIGYGAFDDSMSGSPLKKLHIPSTVQTLGANFIGRCYELTDFSIDSNNPYFVSDGKAIYSTDYQELVMMIPSYRGDYTLSEKCTSIRNHALYANSSITGIIAPNVEQINWVAFWMANKMEYVAIGSKLASISDQVFDYCHNLRDIYLGCSDVPTGNYSQVLNWDVIGECTLYVPSAAIDKFKANSFWSQMKEIKAIEDTDFAYLAIAAPVCFTDNNGNEIEESSVLVMDNFAKDAFGEFVSLQGLNIKNLTDAATSFRLTATIDQLPGGAFQCCLGSACHRLSKPGSISIDYTFSTGSEQMPVVDTEWFVESGHFANLEVLFTLESSDDGTNYVNAGTVVVQFVYSVETGIDAIDADVNSLTNIYTVDGARVNKPTKGINIINGHKVLR